MNPHYELPTDRIIKMYPHEEEKGTKIVKPCKLSLRKYGLILLFNDNRIIFFTECNDTTIQKVNTIFEPLRYFIIYKSFVNYNVDSWPQEEDASLINEVPEVDTVLFNLSQIVKKQIEDKGHKGYYYDMEPCVLKLKRQDIEDFLVTLNYNLVLAICYYLMGCENPKYFLIENYKCVEAIKNHFGNNKSMQQKLESYGFNMSDYRKLYRYANDERKPLSIGRHAPKKNAQLLYIDVKHLLEEPKSRQVFEDSERICRSMIDMFILYLKGC